MKMLVSHWSTVLVALNARISCLEDEAQPSDCHSRCVIHACHFLFWKTYYLGHSFCVSGEEIAYRKCPGMYCGRTVYADGNRSDCGACPRGSRPDGASVCRECNDEPTFYDWLYLGFMALLAPALHCFFIDFTNKRKNGGLIILHVSAVLECILAAVCTILVSEPRGSMEIKSCPAYYLSDWYTMLYNPTPDYTTTLYCTQEVVYPLYTIVMIYYAFGLVAMMLVRPLLSSKLVHNRGSKSIYAALYFFPILVVIQAVFAGLLYYSFPYIILVLSIITSAAHFTYFEVQDVRYLITQNLTNVRNLTILICHWMLHAYGIVAITELKEPAFHGALLCLVPFPSLFYLITVKYTDPVKIKAENQY